MFFYLSKIIAIILDPIHLLILLVVAYGALSWITKKPRPQKKKTLISMRVSLRFFKGVTFVAMIIMGFNLVVPVLPYQAVQALEHRFPQPDPADLNPAVIIVLGGWQGNGASFMSAKTPPIGSAGDRLIAGLILAKQYPDAKLYFPGGLQLDPNAPSEDDITRAVMAGLNLPASRFIVEGESRNTAENASYVRAMIDDLTRDQVVLITSASHMPRAIGSFRAEGINPIAYPVDHSTQAKTMPWSLMYKQGVPLSGKAIHEWIGLMAYYLTGCSSALFPSP